MIAKQPDPSWLVNVELNVGEPTYLNAAEMIYGEDAEHWWKELGDLLYGRPGWYCEITNSDTGMEMMWSFGALRASLFNISFDGDRDYALFDWEADSTERFSTINELRAWLDVNEERHTDHPRNLHDLVAASDWSVLKTVGFDIDVIFDGETWIATVRRLPVTMSTADSLSNVVSRARDAITHVFDAPPEVAQDIQVRVHLDHTAAAML
ncbi:hypothetical protein NE857_26340 [Nocardiopsis exhalans]|uniref:Uncharacterized protein n=2 Tax=Nocardiopsis TaxID=2013 RepID=A0A840WQC5_9ACTN|nr:MULTISPECIES: hypothetical protein [Nocardiopsis]MBB5492318.1 hypothetical protein [Nocardiopsis metallicus]USY18772.1 hypothetical protein NE857_26340 [Nocardiopsis exhalans]